MNALVGAGLAYATWRVLDDRLLLSHDVEVTRRLLPLLFAMRRRMREGGNTALTWAETCRRSPDKTALVMIEDEGGAPRRFSFADMDRASNRVAHFLKEECGLKAGDTVALFMENRPEFVVAWLGMTKIGVRVAMINTAVVQKGLVHCIKISHAKVLLFGTELQQSVREILPALREELPGLALFHSSSPAAQPHARHGVDFAPSCDEKIARCSPEPQPDSVIRAPQLQDTFGYIYTSGTTGLPKAAIISHLKVLAGGYLAVLAFKLKRDDVLYETLPLFHSAGGMMGIGMCVHFGNTVVIRKKFTASKFFEDCYTHQCTVAQYIGELCRYLVATPPGAFDKKHRVRIFFGNGLRPEIWDEFQSRFNIPEIGEFYGATESNGALVNHCTTKEARGACGRVGALAQALTGLRFVKYDVANDVHPRDSKGFCQPCAVNEPGELFLLIRPNDPATAFNGYEDPKATANKVMRNAFAANDAYFKTGDLLSRDSKGYIRFVDRIGDTFRWKGENCSTTEVSEVISQFPGIEEPNVYGVLIPNNKDGRAPCAAITPQGGDMGNLDLRKLAAYLKSNLPSYAVPLFLRVIPRMELTATLKQTKNVYRDEGIDISVVRDPLFYLDGPSGTYVPLTKEVHARLSTPGSRL